MSRKILIGLACLMSFFIIGLSPGLAQQLDRPVVKLIYIRPSNGAPEQGIDAKMIKVVKDAQLFFANEMERHGFGRKTFLIETDATGRPVVHHVDNSRQIDGSEDIRFIVDSTQAGGGLGGPNGFRSGFATIFYEDGGLTWGLTAHELGHAFGLSHDFRSGDYIMGSAQASKLSQCAAEWLDVHRAFTPGQPLVNEDNPVRIKMLPPTLVSLPNTVRLRFEVSDDDGLYQALFYTQEKPGGGFNGFESCKRLNENISGTVEFVTTGLTPGRNEVIIKVIDTHGNWNGSSWPAGQRFQVDVTSLLPRPEIVSIPDAELAWVVRETLRLYGKAQAFTSHAMLDLKHLNAPNRRITDLTGLEYAINLAELNLGGKLITGEGYVNSNAISDFSPLAGLTNLITLHLSHSSLWDVSFLMDFPQLTSLSLGHNSISDVSVLSDLTQLISLSLESNPITTVASLAGLTQLTFLNLSSNSISDVSPLAGLTELKSLQLHNTALSNVSALSGLTQLTYLGISGTSVSDVSPFATLTQLTSLHLGSNAIADVSPLMGLTQLTSLHLYSNAITDVSALAELSQLTVLDLRYNTITNIEPLVKLNLTGTQWNSTGLYLERNPLSYTSINTHIPAMQARGIEVRFDPRTPITLVKISGAAQQGTVNAALPLPFVVEVRDQQNIAYAGVPVTFSVTAGNGRLSTTTTTTDTNGRAAVHLTFGRTAGTTTVRVTATSISQPVQFTATAVLLSSPVTVPDTNLRTEIAVALGKSRSQVLTVADLLKLTALTANNANIRDLTGLQHASSLKTVSLDNNNLSDVALLAGLPQLTTLSLDDNNLSDVTPLAALTQLTTLSLDNNNLSDVTPLAALAQLITLSLENNSLSDVSSLEGLTQLKTLHLRGNLLSYPSLHTSVPAIQAGGATVRVDLRTPTTLLKVSGTHGVAGAALPLIVEVQDENGFGFSGVPVTFTVTAGGGQLTAPNVITDRTGRARTTLTLGSTPGKNTVRAAATGVSRSVSLAITAVNASSPVTVRDTNLRVKITETLGKSRGVQLTAGDMLALTRLEAPNANIRNLTGIEHAHNLTTLNLGGAYIQGQGWVNSNKVSDFSPLFGLTQLATLNLSFSSLSDASFLSELTQLRSLHLGNNNLSDISALSGLTQLTGLTLWNNAITDVSPLAGLTQLTSLSLSGNTIADMSSLRGLTQLRYLNLGYNSISDVSTLAALTQLISLNLNGNTITDMSPLMGLTQLTSLNLYSNAITDVSVLAELSQLTVLDLRYNTIADIAPLVGLNLTGTQWNNTGLYLERNPLSYASINEHIPAMQAKGIEVQFNSRTPTTLVKISGTAQQGTVNAALPLPFVVEVRDQQNIAFAGVPVTFSVTTGGGRLSTTTITTDAAGRAAAHLTFGRTAGTTTVRVSAAEVSQSVQFTATAVLRSSPVTVADANLRAKIVETLNKPRGGTLTAADMLKLTALTANSANIHDLTGLQHAPNLKTVSLDNNNISDIALLAGLPQLTSLSLDDNNISDVSPLEVLTQLETLSLDDNAIANVVPLAALTQLETLSLNNNNISDVAPLEALTHLKTLHLRGNLLSYPSLHTAVPAIQAGGATVRVDLRTPTTLMQISGTHGVAGAALPLIVEVQDENGFGFSGVPVTFTVTAGGGQLTAPNVITDRTGRARTTLTLGSTPGKNTVRVAATGVSRSVSLAITAINASSPVTIRDVDLRAKIAETLGKSRGVQLTAGDMLALTRLEAPNANIQNLTGLEHAHNLTSLNLNGEHISGQGWVNNNSVSDFSPLFGLAQLTRLSLFSSSLSDVSFLSSLTQLTYLHLGNNTLSDISVLSELTQLRYLYLNNNGITNLSPLAGLAQLTYLHLGNNTLSDISVLSELTQLTYLYLGNTSISDVSALAGLTQLTYLDIASNTISDVSALAGLTQLTVLYLGNNSISDVSPLANLTQLTVLHLYNNTITEVEPLTGLTQLTVLFLYNNTITEVEPLAGLTQLTVLHLYNNTIADMSPLVGLNLTGTRWDSTGLYLERNPLSYASINTHIPTMQAKGVAVKFDNRAHPALLKISGDVQEGTPGAVLATPFVVEVVDARGKPMQGVSVAFTVMTGGGRLSTTTPTTDATGKAETILTLERSPGKQTVTATAPEITRSVLTFTAIAVGEPVRIAEDVNGDGIVNIQDLVLVSSNFGQTGQGSADVNGDGVVNIQDLVLVAGAFGEGAAAAPALHPSDLEGLTAAEVQDLLTQARQMALTDPAYLRGIAVLEQLLALLLPKETALLPNYPNPFNPETWIPYQLATPSDVTLHIYAVNGALVRTLALGHQPAGMYHSRSHAAYWDGRNVLGESVASGVYFYTLTAGEFTATRKMLIRK